MSGQEFHPKRIITRGTIKKLVTPGEGGSLDGAVNYQNEQEALTGSFTRTLAADPPGGFLFECHCGHMRRVTYSETNFRCENGGIGNDCKCPILWTRKQKDSGEIGDDGKPVFVDDTTDETIEVVDEFSGKRRKMKVPRPQFVGRLVGELKAEEFARRAARGEPAVANPTNEVVMLNVETSKQQIEKRLAEKRAKEGVK